VSQNWEYLPLKLSNGSPGKGRELEVLAFRSSRYSKPQDKSIKETNKITHGGWNGQNLRQKFNM
jgi:hypothetical protein